MTDADEMRTDRFYSEQRLEILSAVVSAVDRRVEFFDVIAASASVEVARERVRNLLGVSETAASAVLELQARRFTLADIDLIRAELDRLRRDLGE